MAQTDEMITQSEAAEIRGVSLGAINELVRRGKLRSAERFGKRLVYRSDVEAYEPSPGGWPKGRPRNSAAVTEEHASSRKKPDNDPSSRPDGKVNVKATKKKGSKR
jgi:excisionase family DNA binding protein